MLRNPAHQYSEGAPRKMPTVMISVTPLQARIIENPAKFGDLRWLEHVTHVVAVRVTRWWLGLGTIPALSRDETMPLGQNQLQAKTTA